MLAAILKNLTGHANAAIFAYFLIPLFGALFNVTMKRMMRTRYFTYTRTLSCVLSALATPAALAQGEFPSSLEPVYYSLDPVVAHSLCSDLLDGQAASPFTLEGYTYRADGGYEINDFGFLPTFYRLPPSPRKITLNGKNAIISRDVNTVDLQEVRKLAHEAVLENYEELIQPEIRSLVNEIEDGISNEQVSFGVVKSPAGQIVGVVRVVKAELKNEKVRLPAFDILRRRGSLSEANEQALRLRFGAKSAEPGPATLTNPGEEIGQFYIQKNLSAPEREQIRNRLLLWLVANHLQIVSNNAQSFNIVHTSRLGHYSLWSKGYGFTQKLLSVTDENGITETVAETSSHDLHQKIKEILEHR